MKRHLLMIQGIKSAGYDALCATLELEMNDGKVWKFYDVPEDIWYAWRREAMTSAFFNQHIACRFQSEQIK